MTDQRSVIVFSTVPPELDAPALARTLVVEGLAACVHVSAELDAVYHWQGQVEQSRERALAIKTVERLVEPLERRLLELHPYEVPEFVVVPVVAGSAAYLEWLTGSVRPGGGARA